MEYLNEEDVIAAAEFSSVLRAWLSARREADHIIACGIAYETAALFARNAPSVRDACELVDAWTAQMKEQIRRLGVGVEHP